METKDKANMPEKKFSTGAIQATIWKNSADKNGEQVSYRTIVLSRIYKDKEDKWQSTNSLRLNDLPKASLVLHKAYEYLILKDTENDGIITEAIIKEVS